MKHHVSLEARNLIAGYGRRDVIEITELLIRPGEVTAVLGPNAAGKSTLVRAMAGALRPRQGTVTVGSDDVYRLSARVRATRLAFVAQESAEQFAFTVRELVQLGAEATGNAGTTAKSRVEKALGQLDLEPLADRDLLGLSGGERQRASLARALAQETNVLVLDEPTAHLDLRHQAALMTAVRAASADGTAVLLVLHDLNLASGFADRIILLDRGRIVADGTAEETLNPAIIQKIYQTEVHLAFDGQNKAFIHLAPPK